MAASIEGIDTSRRTRQSEEDMERAARNTLIVAPEERARNTGRRWCGWTEAAEVGESARDVGLDEKEVGDAGDVGWEGSDVQWNNETQWL